MFKASLINVTLKRTNVGALSAMTTLGTPTAWFSRAGDDVQIVSLAELSPVERRGIVASAVSHVEPVLAARHTAPAPAAPLRLAAVNRCNTKDKLQYKV